MTAAVIEMSPNIQPAQINPFLYADEILVKMYGWGLVSKEVYDPNNLHSITLQTMSNDDCRSYHNSEYVKQINENKICTGVVGKNKKGICFGDEGGALFSGSEIIGVASWHSACEPNVPNVYERVAPHRLWILSYIVM